MRFDVDPRMSIQGARNRASGAFFEDAILRVCRHYWLSGQAAIDKTPEPMQPIKDLGGGRFVAHYAKKAQPDFQGTSRAAGQCASRPSTPTATASSRAP